MSFDLDAKAVRFIVEAIQSKIAELVALQGAEAKDENIVAESSNDIMYYRALIAQLRECSDLSSSPM
jgi:hypothetical protein